MLFLGIITIQILQVMVISGDWAWLEPVYLNIYSVREFTFRSARNSYRKKTKLWDFYLQGKNAFHLTKLARTCVPQ